MPVVRVGVARLLERRDRAGAIAERARAASPSANQAAAKPGARSTACSQQVGRRRDVALAPIVARQLVAPVGDQVAGGHEKRRQFGISSARNPPVWHISAPCVPKTCLTPTPAGLCCPPGGFHIDPIRPVDKALITHGHSDHARAGHGAVLATQETLDIMRLRYGEDFAGSTQAIALRRDA